MTKGTALAAVELVLEGGGPMGCGGRMEPFALAATPQLLAGHPHQKNTFGASINCNQGTGVYLRFSTVPVLG